MYEIKSLATILYSNFNVLFTEFFIGTMYLVRVCHRKILVVVTRFQEEFPTSPPRI